MKQELEFKRSKLCIGTQGRISVLPLVVPLTGATGAIGPPLSQALVRRGYKLIVFTRDPQNARQHVPRAQDYVGWDAGLSGDWASVLDGVHGVINLAGENLFDGHLTEERLKAAGEGRVLGTRGLVDAMQRAQIPPRVMVNASSTGVYGFTETGDDVVTEQTPLPRQDIWSVDRERWEVEAYRAEQFGVCTSALRIGVALERGGLLQSQVQQFRAGYGGPAAPGTQWFPWIHIDDIVGLLLFLLEDKRVHGPVNGTAPEVVRNREYAGVLAGLLNVPVGPMTSEESLRQYMGLAAEVTTHLRRVTPARALELGYNFAFPTLKSALEDLLAENNF